MDVFSLSTWFHDNNLRIVHEHESDGPEKSKVKLQGCSVCNLQSESLCDLSNRRKHYSTETHKVNMQRTFRGLAPLTIEEISSTKATYLKEHGPGGSADLLLGSVTLLAGDNEESSKGGSSEPNSGSCFYRFVVSGTVENPPLVSFSLYKEIIDPRKTEDIDIISANLKNIGHRTSSDKESWAIIVAHCGMYALGIVRILQKEMPVWILKHSDKTYSSRKKQGGSQLLRDKKGKVAASAGSFMRRNNELALMKEAQMVLRDNWAQFSDCSLIFNQISPYMVEYIWPRDLISRSDERVRRIPFQTGESLSSSGLDQIFISLSTLYDQKQVPTSHFFTIK